MEDLRYDRLCRTPTSEAYLLSRGEAPLGRVDLHFTHSVVFGILLLEEEIEEQQLQELIEQVDDDLVWSADLPREDFIISVYHGKELGVYSDSQPDEDEDEDVENNGSA